MKALEYDFSENETEQLKKYRDEQDSSRLKMRSVALLMLISVPDPETVAFVVGKTVITVENRFRKYMTEGTDSLNSFRYRARQPYLTGSRISQVIIRVTFGHPGNTKEVREYIKEQFGITYCVEAVRVLLRKHGLRVIRPKTVPGNPPGVEEQKQFVKKYHEIKASAEPGPVVLFGDGMHLIHQNVPGLCRGDPKYPLIPETNTSRKRLNILGAYNPKTHSFHHLTGEENCNAGRTVEFLEMIHKTYHYAPQVTLILDNAKYFHADAVSERPEKNNKISIEFLPGYAPNLNLTERFWRFAKDNLVRNKYYRQYKKFRAKVFQFLNHTDNYIDELRTLMVEKFEIVYA